MWSWTNRPVDSSNRKIHGIGRNCYYRHRSRTARSMFIFKIFCISFDSNMTIYKLPKSYFKTLHWRLQRNWVQLEHIWLKCLKQIQKAMIMISIWQKEYVNSSLDRLLLMLQLIVVVQLQGYIHSSHQLTIQPILQTFNIFWIWKLNIFWFSICSGIYSTKPGGVFVLVGRGPREVKLPIVHAAVNEIDIRYDKYVFIGIKIHIDSVI